MNPEVDEHGVSTDELEQQYDQPSHVDDKHTDPETTDGTKVGGGEPNYVDRIRDKFQAGSGGASYGSSNLGKAGDAVTAGSSFWAKHKKKLILGGAGGALLPIFIFLAFFFLFLKNIHFKHLYFDYRFARFNQNLNSRLKTALEESKAGGPAEAKGNADTTVPKDAPPEAQLEGANQSELDKIRGDAGAEDALGKDLSGLEQSTESTGAAVGEGEGFNRGIEEPNTDDPVKASEAAEKDVGGDSASKVADAPDALKDPAQEAARLQDTGLDPIEAATQAVETKTFLSEKGAKINFEGGFSSAVKIASGPFIFATFYCIFRDLYVTSKDQFAKIVFHGASKVAVETAKNGDCLQLGQCSAVTQGANAQRLDNGKESVVESCGYARASGGGMGKCKDLDPAYLPNLTYSFFGPNAKSAASLVDNVLDPPGPIGAFADGGCPIILKPITQISAAVLNITAIALTDGGVAAGEAVFEGAVFAAGTAGGKALAVAAVAHYGGGLFKKLSPITIGNLTDMGAKVIAEDTARRDGAPLINQADAVALDQEIRQSQIAAVNRKGFFYKNFSPEYSHSLTSQIAVRMPVTPSAVLARLTTFVGTLASPGKLFQSNTLAFAFAAPVTALAPANVMDYSFPSHAFTTTQINRWGIKDNSLWVQANMTDKNKAELDKLLDAPFEEYMTSWDGRKGGRGKWNDKFDSLNDYDPTCTNPKSKGCMLAHYQQYRFDQRMAHDIVLRYNKQSDKPAPTAITPPGTDPAAGGGSLGNGKIFLMGDSISVLMRGAGLDAKLKAKGWNDVCIDALGSRPLGNTRPIITDTMNCSVGSGPVTEFGLKQIDVALDKKAVANAGTVVIALGTNDGPTANGNFRDNVIAMIGKVRASNATAQIFWVNVYINAIAAPPSYGNYKRVDFDKINSILNELSGPQNFKVLDWNKEASANAGKYFGGDVIHPKNPGAMVDWLAGALPTVSAPPSGGTPPSGSVQDMAKQILANSNVTYPYDAFSPNGSSKAVLQALAAGQAAPVTCRDSTYPGTPTADINPKILQFVIESAQQTKLGVNALTDKCHSSSASNHYKGKAIDLQLGIGDLKIFNAIAVKYGGKKNSETNHHHFDFP